MTKLSIDSAIRQLVQADHASRSERSKNPFIFVVGAGISVPEVPAASKIVANCYEKLAMTGKPEFGNPMAEYSWVLSEAFPQPVDRQLYLRTLIENAKITHANLALAHILTEGSIARLVLTTNFDDLLERSLQLLGAQYLVCDHPFAVGRVDPEDTRIQIVHVHGSYQFYDLANLSTELGSRAVSIDGDPMAVPDLLAHCLWDRSPIVVGYSGWEDDAIMVALRRRLRTGLKRNVYWFCYREDEADDSPLWLRQHPNVCFVVPQDTNPAGSRQNGRRAAQPVYERAITELQDGGIGDAQSTDEAAISVSNPDASKKSVLSASTVFSRMIAAFELRSPLITSDPLKFFVEQVKSKVAASIGNDVESDIYRFNEVLERLEAIRTQVDDFGPDRRTIARLFDAMRRSSFDDLLTLAEEVDPILLTPAENRSVVAGLNQLTTANPESNEKSIRAAQLIRRYLKALSVQTRSARDLKAYGDASFRLASRLRDSNQGEAQLAIYTGLLAELKGDERPVSIALSIDAEHFIATTLAENPSTIEEALNIFGRLEEGFKGPIPAVCGVAYIGAMDDYAKWLAQADGKRPKALQLREDVIAQYKNSRSVLVGRKLGRVFEQLMTDRNFNYEFAQSLKAASVFDDSAASNLGLREWMNSIDFRRCGALFGLRRDEEIKALVSKIFSTREKAMQSTASWRVRFKYYDAVASVRLGQNETALAILLEISRDRKIPSTDIYAVRSRVLMAQVMRRLGRFGEATGVLEEVVNNVSSTNVGVIKSVNDARKLLEPAEKPIEILRP